MAADSMLDDGLGVMLFHDAVWVYVALLHITVLDQCGPNLLVSNK